MAEKVLKEFTYDGYGVVVEVAKRDDQGNNIAKTYVRQEVTDKLRSDLDAEIKRATEAESTLQNNINTLTSNAVLDDEVEIDDNNLIKEITIGGDKKKIVAERAINDENGNNIVDTYATIAENNETNAKLAQEIERAKAAESEITDNLNSEITRAKAAEATLKNDIDAETARATSAETLLTSNLNAEVERAKTAEGVLQTNIDSEIKNRESAIDTVTTSLNNEIKRSTDVDTQLTQDVSNLGDNLQKETDRASQAEENLHTELTTQIGLEREARTNADDALSDRIERLEGKTTRLYYGEGTLTSPNATEIQNFVTNLEVNPPYAPPYSGLAVVVYLTDEKTYHIWHYYTNLASWKDDGIDTVTTFTNTTKGIIQGSTNEGYISADNGLGKVNGFSELKEQVGNNYDTLNTKIEEETTRATGVEESLRNDLTAEVSRAKAAEQKLTTDLTAEVSRATEAETQLDAKITAETTRATGAEETLQANIDAEEERATQAESTLTTNLNKEIQDRTNADEALKTNIENGTIVANKSTNDSDGNPINTTYVKVEGFKTNYLDNNNVMYKDDIQVLDEVSKGNKPLPGLNIKGVNYNNVSITIGSNDTSIIYATSPSTMDAIPNITSSSLGFTYDGSLILTNELVFREGESIKTGTSIILTNTFRASNFPDIYDSFIVKANSSSSRFNKGIESSIIIPSSNTKFKTSEAVSNSIFIETGSHGDAHSTVPKLKNSVVLGKLQLEDNKGFADCIAIGAGVVGTGIPGIESIAIGDIDPGSGNHSILMGYSVRVDNTPNNIDNIVAIGSGISIRNNSENCIALGNYTKTFGYDTYRNGYIFVDSSNINRTLVLKSTSNILFRNADIDNEESITDFSKRKTLYEYLNEKADKTALANKVDKTTTVNGHALSSNVTITKADVELGNVVNTGDSAAPVSGGTTKFTTGGAYTLQQTLQGNIDTKQDTLIAGTGISITDNTISCTVTSPVTATDVVIDLK